MENFLIESLEIIKEIGKGGFGTVYLVRDKESNFYALKKVNFASTKYAKKELRALEIYQKFAKTNKTENLIEILDIKVSETQVEYLMPLADGIGNLSPLDKNYKPITLKYLVEGKYAKGELFTKDDVLSIFSPIFKTVEKFNARGIVHRDIKPENIIFIKGKAYIADIGLFREDTYSISSAGTPAYTAPTWYTKTGGKVDMWGIASSLYFFLTGNSPDTMGRANYMYPLNKDKMPKEDIKAWQHFHRVILRATREKSNERYITFEDFTYSFEKINEEKIDVNSSTYAQKDNPAFSIKGRLNRKEFAVYFSIFYCLCFYCLLSMTYDSLIGDLAIVAAYIFKYLCVMCVIKRLHDANLSGFWAILIYFIASLLDMPCSIYLDLYIDIEDDLSYYGMLAYHSLVIILVLIACLCFKSDKHTNRFGVANQKLKLF